MSDSANPLAGAMQQLWTRFLPQMEERVAVVSQAASAYAAGTLTTEQRAAAAAEAHKLAGVLGTFGLMQGTELAREAEGICSDADTSQAARTARLAEIAEQLRTMIAAAR